MYFKDFPQISIFIPGSGYKKAQDFDFQGLALFYMNFPLLEFTGRHFVRKMPSFTDGHLNFRISSMKKAISMDKGRFCSRYRANADRRPEGPAA